MLNFSTTVFLEGMATSMALGVAIGAQNAFVLKQGILQNHVFTIALVSSLVDSVLIIIGINGLGLIFASNAITLICARWGGAAFLGYYGFRSFKIAFKNESLKVSKNDKILSLKATILTTLTLSLLNPHVYLDTVVLLGSIGAQFASDERLFFISGSILSSFIWFFALGYGAKYLIPFFRKPSSWKILDCITGITMWAVAISLFFK